MRFLFSKKKDFASADDASLILEYKTSGNKEIISELFQRYAHLVFGVCMKYLKDEDESKDAALQIFEKLMDDLRKFEIQKFSFWLHAVSKNYCLMQLRNRQSLQQKEEELKNYQESAMETGELFHLFGDDTTEKHLAHLHEAIQTLSTEQKICIELFYLKEKCYNEISELTGFDFKQVKSFIQNGKRNLKIFLLNKVHEQQ